MLQAQDYMNRCIELARLGQGSVSPNPMVGCVIVHNEKIIGEGWHQQFGGAHAEVNAIQNIADKELLSQSTVYVNLEPCSHFGKTPPCADLLISHRVEKVVVGMQDPFSEVAGQGIQKLRDAGIEVEVGILEEACKDLNKRFVTFHEQKRPFVILKWAQTSDGFLSPDAGKLSAAEFEVKRHITGLEVQALVHKWRGEEDAVMVGTNTVLSDNPTLNTRAYPGKKPQRITMDMSGRLTMGLKILDGTQPTLIFTNKEIAAPNAQTTYIKIEEGTSLWPQMLMELYERKIQSMIVEGGAFTLTQIIRSGIWDEAQVFTAPKLLGEGVRAPAISGKLLSQASIANNQLHIYQRI